MDPSLNGEEQLEELPAEEAPAPPAPEEFQFVTLPPEVSFATREVMPPAECYISRQDRLFLWIWNAVAGAIIDVHARILKPDGTLIHNTWTYTPTSNGVLSWYVQGLAEGFLLTLTVNCGYTRAGGCYVRAALLSGGAGAIDLIAQTLVAGYVVRGSMLCWPYPRYVGPCEGPGRLRVIVGTDPAAGFQILEAVPANARWRLLAVRAELLTSAVAGNRHITLGMEEAPNVWWQSTALVAQPPSWTHTYTWAVGVDARIGVPAGWVQDRLPDKLTLAAGWRFYTGVIGWDVGDDWGAPVYYVEEWVEP